MEQEPLRQIVSSLLESQRLAVLSTEGAAFPHASLVAFAASGDLRTLVFATLHNTRKYNNIARNPRVAMTVDNRIQSGEDLLHTIVATAVGSAREIPPQERDSRRDAFLARHPSLQQFVDSPDCALMAVAVQSYDIITDFQAVSTLPLG